MTGSIKDYWENRAAESGGQRTATTDDVYLRELEIATIVDTLKELVPQSGTLLDAGCGDGHTTIGIVRAIPKLRATGIDFSAQMVAIANRRLREEPELAARVEFLEGDVTHLNAAISSRCFDFVLTDRCLINLHSYNDQRAAIAEIARHIPSGGHYLAIENFVEGQENMNVARRSLDLPEIRVRWHNIYFTEQAFLDAAVPYFDLITFKDFASSYYFATRVVYSKLCQLRRETPDYQHNIHRLAVNLPWSGKFSPIRMAVLRRRD